MEVVKHGPNFVDIWINRTYGNGRIVDASWLNPALPYLRQWKANKEVKIKRINVAKVRARYGKMSGKQRAEKGGTTQVKAVINKNKTMR